MRTLKEVAIHLYENRHMTDGDAVEAAAAEIERLTAENERLRFALHAAKDFLDIGAGHATTGAALRAIGDGLSAVQQRATTEDEKMADPDAPTKTAIRLEKAMLEVLGRPWTPTGISVESLVYELIEEVKRLRRTSGEA